MKLQKVALAAVLCTAVAAAPARAQDKGLYIPGQFGLNAGTLPDPGLTYKVLGLNYSSTDLRGPDGESVATTGHDKYWIQENVLTYVPGAKVLGGNLAFGLTVPVTDGSLTVSRFNTPGGSYGVGDVFVQPLEIGWRLTKVDFNIGYAFVAPTGRYDPTRSDNIGAGYWGQMVTSGTTVFLSRHGSTRANLYMNWENHGHQEGTGIVPGQTFTFEWGVGHVFPLDRNRTALLELGIVGYDQSKVSEDGHRAEASSNLLDGMTPMYRVHAAGAQANVVLPPQHLTFFGKFEAEYSATNRPKGYTLVFGAKMTMPFGGAPVPEGRP